MRTPVPHVLADAYQPLRIQLGDELWILDLGIRAGEAQLREVLIRVGRVSGVRDERKLEGAFLQLLGVRVLVARRPGAELVYTVIRT